MARVRDGNVVCGRCGAGFTLTRQGQEECWPCRRLRAVQRHAAKRLAQLQPMLTALENLQLWVEAEVGRWERIAHRP
jgi:hypothetical protein